jgi:hypothetical protein
MVCQGGGRSQPKKELGYLSLYFDIFYPTGVKKVAKWVEMVCV